MKFGRTYAVFVQTEAQRLLPECPYVEFKRFKKMLKRCSHLTVDSEANVSMRGGVTISACDENLAESKDACGDSCTRAESEEGSSASSCPMCDAEFFPSLDKEISAVVGCFNARAKELLRLHTASGLRKYVLRMRRRIAGDRRSMIQIGNTLFSYGCMNALAIRKLLKKYDKVHSSENGQAFKSRLQVNRVELLQSPLLVELGALAVNLMDAKVPHVLTQAQEPGYSICSFDNNKNTISCVILDEMRLDFDLMCSICLDIVFDPLALGCGHIFCTSCACAAASVSTFLGAKSARRSSKCPLCRQTGVYPHAMQMRELFRLIRNRCRQYCAERLPAERALRVREAKEHWDRQTQMFLGTYR